MRNIERALFVFGVVTSIAALTGYLWMLAYGPSWGRYLWILWPVLALQAIAVRYSFMPHFGTTLLPVLNVTAGRVLFARVALFATGLGLVVHIFRAGGAGFDVDEWTIETLVAWVTALMGVYLAGHWGLRPERVFSVRIVNIARWPNRIHIDPVLRRGFRNQGARIREGKVRKTRPESTSSARRRGRS